jgi:hypothetical protein
VQEKAPEVYKPREGKVNANSAKFSEEHITYMQKYAGDTLKKLGYSHLFTQDGIDVQQLIKFNSENL